MNAATAPAAWAPRAGSLAHRVLEFLARNPDEELYIADIAQKFDTEKGSVQHQLTGAETAGALQVSKDESGKRVYRLGNYAGKPGAASVFSVAPSTSAPSITAQEIRELPVESIPFPDPKRELAEAQDALAKKLRELSVGQCIPVSPALKPLLRRAIGALGPKAYKVKAIPQGEFCWRVA